MFQSQVLNHLQNTLQPSVEIDVKGQESRTENPGINSAFRNDNVG